MVLTHLIEAVNRVVFTDKINRFIKNRDVVDIKYCVDTDRDGVTSFYALIIYLSTSAEVRNDHQL